MFWWNFNLEIYQSAVGSSANPYGNQVPPDFFVDLNMRKAFAYAFNYQQYLDQIVGNKKFGATFGTPFNGIIPSGMVASPTWPVPASRLRSTSRPRTRSTEPPPRRGRRTLSSWRLPRLSTSL